MRRRRRFLSLVLVLVWIVAAGVAPALARGQEGPGTWGEGLTITQNDGAGRVGVQMRSYSVAFEPGAFVPEERFPEAMVVKVVSGTFAFRAQSDVLIDPQGGDIVLLKADPVVPVEHLPAPEQQFKDDGMTLANCAGTAPQTLCLVNPTILMGRYVKLTPGFLVYLPDATTCFFCNTKDIVTEGQTGDESRTAGETPTGGDGELGELLVWTPKSGGGFSWFDRWQDNASLAGTPVAGEPTPSAEGLTAARGWMRFNPGSPCN